MISALGRRICDLRECSAGVVAVLTAMVLPLLLGFAGLGTEVGHWYLAQRQMQGAADAAAISAAAEYIAQTINGNTSSTTYQQVGQSYASLNGFTIPTSNVCLVTSSGDNCASVRSLDSRTIICADPPCVVVEITQNTMQWLTTQKSVEPVGHIGGVQAIPTPTLKARAIVSAISTTTTNTTTTGGGGCVLALANAANAVQIRGNGNLQANCGLFVDGGIDQTVSGTPVGSLSFQSGNAVAHISSLTVAGSTTPGCPGTNCLQFGSTTQLAASAIKRNTATLSPTITLPTRPSGNCVTWTGTPVAGTAYCSINISGGTTTFPTGTYFIEGGDANCIGFCVSGNNTTVNSASGGVLFVLTNGSGTGAFGSSTFARINITSGNVSLSALGNSGILIIQGPTTTSGLIALAADGTTTLTGVTNVTTSTSLGSSGTPAPFGVTSTTGIAISNAGSGYANGTQTFTIRSSVTGTITPLSFTATVSGGKVTAIQSIVNPGVYDPAPTGAVPVTVGNATFTLTMTSITINTFAGNGTRNLSGLIYLPRQTVTLQGNGPVNGCAGMIAKFMDVAGTPTFTNGCLPSGGFGGTTTTTTTTTWSTRLSQ